MKTYEVLCWHYLPSNAFRLCLYKYYHYMDQSNRIQHLHLRRMGCMPADYKTKQASGSNSLM